MAANPLPSNFDREDARNLQMALNEKTGSTLYVDGMFGAKSIAALTAFQKKNALPVTSIYDQSTQALLAPFIAVKYLQKNDYLAAAQKLGVSTAHIQAVVQVEAGGDGFLPDGRVDILYERHIFYRELKKRVALTESSALAKQYPNLINPVAGGYYGNAREYERLNIAVKINRECAYLATSWGFGQVMGFNFKLAGFSNVFDFVTAMQTSEAEHLKAMVNFIAADPRLVNALARRDWARFAEIYNGPKYAINKYDSRLAQAYATFA